MLVRVAWHQEVKVAGEATLKQVEDENETAVRKQEVEEGRGGEAHDSVANASD